jgi:L-malate glycosyltransferase
MIKVLYVSTSHHMGGAENSLVTLAGNFNGTGVHPVIASPPNRNMLNFLEQYEVPRDILDIRPFRPISIPVRERKLPNPAAICVNIFRMFSVIRQLRGIICRYNIEIVHANDLLADIAAGIAGKLAGKPVLWYLRDNISKGIKRSVFDLLGLLLAARIVAVSKRTRSLLKWSRKKSMVIYNGVDLRVFDGKGSAECFKEDGGKTVIGMVGRISEAKGYETFLRAARNISDSNAKVRFYIVGGPKDPGQKNYFTKLQGLSRSLGMDDFVTFLGERADMPAIYAGMDILMLPSMREALPRTLIEAQVSGTALIASDVGGVREIIEDGVNGFVINDWKDSSAFAQKALQLTADFTLLEQMKERGRTSVRKKFDIQNIISELHKLYKTVGA